MKIEEVFNEFVSSLKDRKGFLSEDNIRFYWFASMLKQDRELNHYSLEEPYDNNEGNHKELDLMYENDNERWCMEIKFHKHPAADVDKSKKVFAHTMSAGEIFDDLRRLPLWQKDSRDNKATKFLFLYVTDNEMHYYLSNMKEIYKTSFRQELTKFYSAASKDSTFDCEFNESDRNTPKTFFKHSIEHYEEGKILGYLKICGLRMIETDDISCCSNSLQHNESSEKRNCHIRLYEITN